MKVVETAVEQSTVCMSRDELLLVNAALNEVCNGIEVFEFETRLGASRQRVADLLREVGLLIDQMESLDR
jgi:hypothetical protein